MEEKEIKLTLGTVTFTEDVVKFIEAHKCSASNTPDDGCLYSDDFEANVGDVLTVEGISNDGMYLYLTKEGWGISLPVTLFPAFDINSLRDRIKEREARIKADREHEAYVSQKDWYKVRTDAAISIIGCMMTNTMLLNAADETAGKHGMDTKAYIAGLAVHYADALVESLKKIKP